MANYRDTDKILGKTSAANFEEADDPGKPVIISPDAPPRRSISNAYEPRIIEVIFKEEIQPDSLMPSALPSDEASAKDASHARLKGILEDHGILRIERSFRNLQNVERASPKIAHPEEMVEFGRENYLRFYFPFDKDVVQISQDLSELPEVAQAVPVPKAIPPTTPLNEPFMGNNGTVFSNPATGHDDQWYVFRCRTNRAWKDPFNVSGAGVVIADIDHGFRVTHEELSTRIELKYNSLDGNENVSQGREISHGTAVLGLAGAAVNGRGMAGFAFGASLWAIQANCGTEPLLEGDPWANAIDHVRCADSGGKRKIILLEVQTECLGNYEMVPSVNQAIKDAIACNIVVCVAAGNGDRDAGISDMGVEIPATGSILVGATVDSINQRAGFSNYGRQIVVSAPGDSESDVTCGSERDDDYIDSFGGTSGAAAKVAGAIALMLEINSELSHEDVKEILMMGRRVISDPLKPAGKFLNVEAAVSEAKRRAEERLLTATLLGGHKESRSRPFYSIFKLSLYRLGRAFLRRVMRRAL